MSDDLKRLILVPRWGGWPYSDWYPYFRGEIWTGAVEGIANFVLPDYPDVDSPKIDEWLKVLDAVMGDDPEKIANTILITHSLGTRAAMHFLSRKPADYKVLGLFAVAGWWTLDKPWPGLEPWAAEIDIPNVAPKIGKTVVVLSDNDEYTKDYQGNAALWRERLDAAVEMCPGANHFFDEEIPELVEIFAKHFGE
ncbi:MAG: alpha/beta hydrolase [Deltaproteobacteria bacterium]|nr:alpha/beta hydrolase [Deltaproteobacteria bacterium]